MKKRNPDTASTREIILEKPSKNGWGTPFYSRVAVCFALVAAMLFLSLTRVAKISTNRALGAAGEQNTFSYTLYPERGIIYDCKMRPLTNAAYERRGLLIPSDEGLAAASLLLQGDELSEAVKTLLSGMPTTAPLGNGDLPKGVIEYYYPVRYSYDSLCHILGYVDSSGRGVAGIEKGFDEVLSGGAPTRALFSISANRDIISDFGAVIKTGERGGKVVLTIDRDIQLLCEKVFSKVDKGAAVVIEADSGKIRAMLSKPAYNQNNISESLYSSDSPLVNRALSGYPVGSVFKLLVSASAIDSGISLDTNYCCNGSFWTGSSYFGCHQKNGHGEMNMRSAIAESCNVFFYNTVLSFPAERILETARRCSFASDIDLGGELAASKGNLPNEGSLTSLNALCNLAIGQGELLASPLAVSNLYSAIAMGGSYKNPTLLQDSTAPESYVMSRFAADTLKEYLINAISEGTGRNARPKSPIVAGGKTATAQTGRYENGKELLVGWYCGFAEINGKTYVVCTLCEDVSSGASDCAPLFAEICDGIYSIFPSKQSLSD